MSTTRWLLWSDETHGQYSAPFRQEQPPSKPPSGGEIHVSADGNWLTVYAPRKLSGSEQQQLAPVQVFVRADAGGAGRRGRRRAERTQT